MTSVDEFREETGVTFFHWILAVVVGLGNAGDAIELISMGYIIATKSFNDEFQN